MLACGYEKVLMYQFQDDYIKKNMATNWDYYLLTVIVRCMKLKLKMFMKILVKTKKCLVLVIK